MRADVAKLADALDLGSSALTGVPVQVRPSAPIKSINCKGKPPLVFGGFFALCANSVPICRGRRLVCRLLPFQIFLLLRHRVE